MSYFLECDLSYDERLAIEIANFEHICGVCEDFIVWLRNNTDLDFSVYYEQGFMNYFKHSELGNVRIKLNGIKAINNHIGFNSALYLTDKPFKFFCWKYENGGEFGFHHDKELDWAQDYTKEDFPRLYDYICDFFKLKKEPSYIQGSLFDFL